MPPGAYQMERLEGDKCEIVFYTNVKEIEHDEDKLYEYDLYRIKTIFRESLAESIEANYDAWINSAIIDEEEEKLNPKLTNEEKIKALDLGHEVQEVKISDSESAINFLLMSTMSAMTFNINNKNVGGGNMPSYLAKQIYNGALEYNQVVEKYPQFKEDIDKLLKAYTENDGIIYK